MGAELVSVVKVRDILLVAVRQLGLYWLVLNEPMPHNGRPG